MSGDPMPATFGSRLLPQHAVLPEAERVRRAEHAKTAHFKRLALASARARRSRAKPETRDAA